MLAPATLPHNVWRKRAMCRVIEQDFSSPQILRGKEEANAAPSPKLKAAFEKHLAEPDVQVERLEQVFAPIESPG
jgi:Domain of unknown function (DUF892)